MEKTMTKKYKVTATLIVDTYLDVEADTPQEAYDEAENRPEDFIEEEFSGEWRIDNVYEYTPKGEEPVDDGELEFK
jgi:hypothetical protein|tara:strand:- start:1469 stop:1696 length:228 start_codon:yes stop_codon:yes gene_type:complete